jgi:heme-degrading monooxygenase HmoA
VPVLRLGDHELIAIDLFEVPTGDDADFLAAWEAEATGGVLYRVLGDDVRFRYVGIDRDAAVGYDVVHEDGEPDGAAGTTLIAAFEVEPGDDDAFVAGWRRTRTFVAGQRGFIGGRLCRDDAAAFRFVEITGWSSPLMVHRATRQPGYEPPSFRVHTALYLAVASTPTG